MNMARLANMCCQTWTGLLRHGCGTVSWSWARTASARHRFSPFAGAL